MWIENSDSHVILYSEEFQIQYKKRNEEQRLEFAIPVFPPFPEYYTLRVSSDHWLGADVITYLPLRGLRMPRDSKQQTPLLDLDPLPVTALQNKGYQSFYRFTHFNAVQTQVFFKSYHTGRRSSSTAFTARSSSCRAIRRPSWARCSTRTSS